MSAPKQNPKCYNCPYSEPVPGSSHHLECHYHWLHKDAPNVPEGSDHGVRNGWFFFPVNFDPIWMENECAVNATERDPIMVRNPVYTIALVVALSKLGM